MQACFDDTYRSIWNQFISEAFEDAALGGFPDVSTTANVHRQNGPYSMGTGAYSHRGYDSFCPDSGASLRAYPSSMDGLLTFPVEQEFDQGASQSMCVIIV